ncbi:MAG: thioredoxin [Dialister sp.]|nr:thioredoxin [Dialister sp.]
MITTIETLADFNEKVEASKGYTLVDFWATWCPPCRMMGPVLEKTAALLEGKVAVAKVDTDTNSETAAKFDIMSIPTFIIFKDGKELTRIIGACQLDDFLRQVKEVCGLE